MTLRKYLLLIGINVAIFWLILAIIIFFINPEEASGFLFILFYIIVFLAITGTILLLIFLAKIKIKKDIVVAREFKNVFRQSVLIGILADLSLIMLVYDLLKWWNFIILCFVFLLVELLYISYKS